MDDKRVEFLLDKLQAFSFGTLQEARNILDVLENSGARIEEFRAFVAAAPKFIRARSEEQAKQARELVERDLLPRCPECGAVLAYQTMMKCRKANPRGWKGIWLCREGWHDEDPQEWCGFSQLTMLTLERARLRALETGEFPLE